LKKIVKLNKELLKGKGDCDYKVEKINEIIEQLNDIIVNVESNLNSSKKLSDLYYGIKKNIKCVYILSSGSYELNRIHGVFDDLNIVEQIKEHYRKNGWYLNVEKYIINEYNGKHYTIFLKEN